MIISLLRTTKIAIVRHAQTAFQNNTHKSMYLNKFKHIVSTQTHNAIDNIFFSPNKCDVCIWFIVLIHFGDAKSEGSPTFPSNALHNSMLNIVLFSTAQKFSKLLYLKYLSNHSCDYCQRKMLPNTFAIFAAENNKCARFCSCKQKFHRNANNSRSFHQFMPLCRVPSHFTRPNFSNRITTKIHNAKANAHCRIATEIVIVIMYLCRWEWEPRWKCIVEFKRPRRLLFVGSFMQLFMMAFSGPKLSIF